MLYSVTFPKIFKVKLSNWLFWQVNARKMQTLLLPSDRKSGICNRMVPLRMLSIMTLSYIFKVTKFDMWISRKRWELTKKCACMTFIQIKFFPSNGTIANVVLRGFDLNFQGQIFQMQISLKWLAKHASYGFYRFWYLPLNGAILKVVLCDVSLHFQGQIFQILISRKRCELRKYV